MGSSDYIVLIYGSCLFFVRKSGVLHLCNVSINYVWSSILWLILVKQKYISLFCVILSDLNME